MGRCQQFLHSPGAVEPVALSEVLQRKGIVDSIVLDIGQMHVANRRPLIPLVHRVDGLRQLRAASLVDAAGVNPDPFISTRVS